MANSTVRMRLISTVVLAALLVCVTVGLATKQLQNASCVAALICFAVGATMAGRIGFYEVPTDRLWIIFGLPLSLAAYAIGGFMLGWGHTVPWAVIALAYIAGGRAANLRQMFREDI